MASVQSGQTGTIAYAQLIGAVGQVVPQPIAKELVAQAWRRICQARNWSFLRAEGYLIAPGALLGNISFTRGSVLATADSSLRALIETPSIPSLVGIGKLSIRGAAGGIYQIRAYDSGAITLHRPFLGQTGTVSITIFRQYFTPPISEVSDTGGNVESGNFRGWISIADSATQYRWIDWQRPASYIDRIDPTRNQTGEPYYIVQATYDALGVNIPVTGTPLFELWPHYVGNSDKIYSCRFYRDWIPLSDDLGDVRNVLPHAIPLGYLTAQARLTAYEWAEANKGDYPKLGKTNWIQLIQVAAAQVQQEELDAQRIDEERYPENVDSGRRSWEFGYYNPQTTMPAFSYGY